MARSRPPEPASTPPGLGLGDAVGGLAALLGKLPLVSAFAPLVGVFQKLADLAGGMASTVKANLPDFSGVKADVPKAPNLALGAAAPAAPAAAPAAGAGGLLSSLGGIATAAAAVPAALFAIVGAAQHFAGLLSPTTLLMFQAAVKDTSAAFGVMLLPVLQVAVGVVRDAGALILPVAQQLQPIFRRLADLAGDNLTRGMETLAGAVMSLVPLFDAAVSLQEAFDAINRPIFDLVGLVFDVLGPGFKMLAQEIQLVVIPVKLLGDMLSDAMKAIRLFGAGLASAFGATFDLSAPLDSLKAAAEETRAGFQGVLKSLIVFSVALAQALPGDFGDKYKAGILRALEGPARTQTMGIRPAEGARFTDVREWSKSILTAASMASEGGVARKTQEDWLKDIAGELKDMKKVDPWEMVRGWLLDDLPPRIAAALREKAREAAHDLNDNVPGFDRAERGADVVGDWVRRVNDQLWGR